MVLLHHAAEDEAFEVVVGVGMACMFGEPLMISARAVYLHSWLMSG